MKILLTVLAIYIVILNESKVEMYSENVLLSQRLPLAINTQCQALISTPRVTRNETCRYEQASTGTLNVAVEWISLLLRILEVLGSNIGFEADYPE
jgi:hypothetical protein